jgi:dienelactone hydrolase
VPRVSFTDLAGRTLERIYFEDAFAMKVDGLDAAERVSVAVRMDDWVSRAEFLADADGRVDTARDPSVSGSYVGVDPDGLVWSLDRATLKFAPNADLDFEITRANGDVLRARLPRPVEVEGVRVERVTGQPFVGTLITPDDAVRHPGILAFGGSEGGAAGGLGYASTLVRQGYAVLALSYFGQGSLPRTLTRIPLEYFDPALDWLATRPQVRADRLGVIGGSRGGELALLLGSRRADLTAVVADTPSNFVWGGTGDDGEPAWTLAGTPLAAIASKGLAPVPVKNARGKTAYALTPVFEDSLSRATPAEREAARIPVERARASIAMYGGEDDQLWPACSFMRLAMDDLAKAQHTATHQDEAVCFPAAGHALTSLGLPTTWSSSYRVDGYELALAGSPQSTARASRDRDARVRAFFARTLQKP